MGSTWEGSLFLTNIRIDWRVYPVTNTSLLGTLVNYGRRFFATLDLERREKCSTGLALALFANIRQGWKDLPGKNTRAYLASLTLTIPAHKIERLSFVPGFPFILAYFFWVKPRAYPRGDKMPHLDRLWQGILKGEVSLDHWPPVWLVWISLFRK